MTKKKLISTLLAVFLVIGCIDLSIINALTKGSLPNGFVSYNIGENTSGSASFNSQNQFVINGSGDMIAKDHGKVDSYQYIAYKIAGNFSIVARLANFTYDNAQGAQAGIIVRENKDSNDSNYFGVYSDTASNTFRYAFRDYSDENSLKGGAANLSNLTSSDKDLYIKIEKNGSHFKFYVSKDANFSAESTISNGQTVNMQSDEVYVGFAVSKDNATAIFDNVEIANENGIVYTSKTEEVPPTEDVQALPGSFNKVDIGNVEVEGNTTFDASTGVFKVTGSGLDIAKSIGAVDSFHFANKKMSQNFTITARIKDFNNTNSPKAKAGIIIREDNTSDNANYIGVVLDGEKNEIRNAYRDNTSSKSGAASMITGIENDIYVKIVRKGNKYTISVSKDANFDQESTYVKNRTVNITSDDVYVGFGVSNGAKSTQAATATFDNVKIEQNEEIIFDSMANVIQKAPSKVDNVKGELIENKVKLSWNKVDNATSYTIKRNSSLDEEYINVHTTNELSYTDTTVENGVTYNYKVVANNEVGEGESSDIFTVEIPQLEDPTLLPSMINLTKTNNDSEVIAKATIDGNVNNKATLIIAIYDERNQMINSSIASVEVKKGDTRDLSVGLKLTNDSQGYCVKAFLWDNLENLKPLSEVATLN